MKRLLLALGLGSVVLFTGCDKDDNKGGDIKDPLTPEQNKELIQDIAIEFVDEMSAMQELEGVGALTSFGLLSDTDEGGRISASSATKIAKAILGFTYGKASATDFGNASTRIYQDEEEDFTSLEELFDENTGTFTWNFDLEDYDFVDNSTDEVIFKFPSTADGTTNNATLTLSNYTSVLIDNPLDEEYDGDLPTSLDVTLTIDGTQAMAYGFEIDYNNQGVPESIDTELSMDTYSLTVGITNTSTVVGYSVNFMNDTKTLIAWSTEVNGHFTQEAIDAVDESDDPTEIVTDGSFSFTLLDLKFTSDVDFASLWDEIGDLPLDYYPCCDDSRPDLEGNAAKVEDALNEHAEMKAIYISTGRTVANVEFYTFIDVDEDWGDEYVEPGIRMVFEDESKMDVGDFLQSGFDGLEAAINDLIHQINEDLDESDWLDDIDFSDIG